MKEMRFIVMFVFVILIVCGKTNHKNSETLLQVKQVLTEPPDSVIQVLEATKLFEFPPSSPKEYACYCFLTCQAILKKHDQNCLILNQRILLFLVISISSLIIFRLYRANKQKTMTHEMEILYRYLNESELRNSIVGNSKIFKRLNTFKMEGLKPDKLKKAIEEIRENPFKEEEWMNLYREMDLIFNNFTLRLKLQHPTLTAKEVQLACLIKLHMSNTDISYLMNILPNSVVKLKSRLKFALKIIKEKANLTDYVTHF